MQWQIYGWAWLPWCNKSEDEIFGHTDYYFGWLCFQFLLRKWH